MTSTINIVIKPGPNIQKSPCPSHKCPKKRKAMMTPGITTIGVKKGMRRGVNIRKINGYFLIIFFIPSIYHIHFSVLLP
jgi:hypothetical protein